MRVQLQPKILLFDIDGTLLSADGAGRRALARAFEDITGVKEAVAGIDFRGMTDAIIVEMARTRLSLNVSERQILAQYLVHLERELDASEASRALPGATELLNALAPHGDALAIGLGTGNIEPAAFLKLRRVGLDGYFHFGGFGSDHRLRSEILRKAALRGSQRLRRRLSECDIVVIGDTFHDVDAALEIGARAVCVGTSGIALDQLRARGAQHAFESLADPDVLRVLLDSGPPPTESVTSRY